MQLRYQVVRMRNPIQEVSPSLQTRQREYRHKVTTSIMQTSPLVKLNAIFCKGKHKITEVYSLRKRFKKVETPTSELQHVLQSSIVTIDAEQTTSMTHPSQPNLAEGIVQNTILEDQWTKVRYVTPYTHNMVQYIYNNVDIQCSKKTIVITSMYLWKR